MFVHVIKLMRVKLMRALTCVSLATGLALAAGIGPALAQGAPSVDQIVEALRPKHLTRSLDTSTPMPSASAPNSESQFLDSLRNRSARSITFTEREKINSIEPGKQGLDLGEITFAYNSAKLTPSAMPAVRNLGEALSRAELKGSTFLIEGHTDAKGGVAYNQRLSERRAEAVKRFLVAEYHVPAANLVAVGYGKSRPKNPSDPLAAENRRVRVINTSANVANE
jgi:outer membrane protein OmpA-like peptidoglycan-associated protein